jgi:hypothetical protein
MNWAGIIFVASVGLFWLTAFIVFGAIEVKMGHDNLNRNRK